MITTAGLYHWLLRGDGYQITSGPIIVISAWVYGIAWLRHHNCHVKGCWRLGHLHPEHGRPVCRHHHPAG